MDPQWDWFLMKYWFCPESRNLRAWDSQNNALITLLVTMERKDCLWLCQRTDTEPDDAQTRRPRSVSLTVKPQQPLGAVKSAELWTEMLIYGGNSKPLEEQRWHNAHWLAEVKFKILWLGEKYILRLFGGLLAEIWLFVCTIYMIEISQFSVTGGLLLGHLGQLSSQGGEIHPGKCGWKSLHPSYLQVTKTGFAWHRSLENFHLKLCWAWRCQIFDQISGHLDGPGERLRAGWVQKSHRFEEDLASLKG